ncbi:MAG: TRAM domain-containing protein, partial [Nitrosomonas sp.]|nr:TRAM domain-containing protein [Nitrosomonas sp.]
VNLAGNPELTGRFVNVRITEARAHSLRGELVYE